MARLVTVVRTYFEGGEGDKGGSYRDNTIEIDIPDAAAELIKEYWEHWGVCFNCVKAKFLASNQAGICHIYKDKGGEEIAGIQGMPQEKTQEEEVFEQHFKDEEEDDE